MKKYEKSISLKTLWLTFVRRFDILLICFIPLCIAAVISTQFIMKKRYVSTVTLAKSTIITNEQYQNIETAARTESLVKKALESLETQNVKHSDGSAINPSEIENGLSFPAYSANSISLSFSFASSDKTVSRYVLGAIASCVVDELKTRSAYSDLQVVGAPSEAKLDGKNNKYLLIACGAGLVLSYALAFVFEFASDEVYDASDVQQFGVDCVEIKLKNENKVSKNEKDK